MQKPLTIRTNLLLASIYPFLLALRFIGAHHIHWVPIILMAAAGVATGLLAARAILKSKDALLGAESEAEVNAILRQSSGPPMVLLGSISAVGVVVIAVAYRDPYFWTALTSFFALVTAYFLARFIAIYRLNKGISGQDVHPAA